MRIDRQYFGQHIGCVLVRANIVHDENTFCGQLAHFEVTPVDVTRLVTRLAISRQRHSPRVVNVQLDGLLRAETKLAHQHHRMLNLYCTGGGSNDLRLGR